MKTMNTNASAGQIKSDIKSRATRGLQVRSGLRAGNTAASSGSKTKSSDQAQQQILDYVKS